MIEPSFAFRCASGTQILADIAGLAVGYIEVNRAHGLGSPDTQLHPRVVIRVGGFNKFNHSVSRVVRIGRQRDLVLGALEPDRVVAQAAPSKSSFR